MAFWGMASQLTVSPKASFSLHAVLIDRQALRRALQRGGVEAVKAQILEQAVALHIAQADAGRLRAQRRQHCAAMLGA